jgi:hypothetical protein
MDEYLTCNICKKCYCEPVVLPCGKNVCKAHLDHIFHKTNGKIFECNYCNKHHEIPESGFIINEDLMGVLDVYYKSDQKRKEANDLISKFEQNIKEIDRISENPESFIIDYITCTRIKIKLEKDRLLTKINKISDEMLEQLENYEVECKSNLRNLNDLIEKSKASISVLEEECEKWKDDLRILKLPQDKLDTLMIELRRYLKENQENLIDYKNELLHNKGCYFKASNFDFDEKLFGEFKIDESVNFKTSEKDLINSHILSKLQSIDLIALCGFHPKVKLSLIYRATRDGFKAGDFHRCCDGLGKTLTIVKVKDNSNIFGGYTEAIWDSKSGYKADKNSFIFSLVNRDKNSIKINIDESCIGKAIYCHSSYGPTFGDGSDFTISSDSNINRASYSNLGYCYIHPDFVKGTNKTKCLLAGSYYFHISEIEVYLVS